MIDAGLQPSLDTEGLKGSWNLWGGQKIFWSPLGLGLAKRCGMLNGCTQRDGKTTSLQCHNHWKELRQTVNTESLTKLKTLALQISQLYCCFESTSYHSPWLLHSALEPQDIPFSKLASSFHPTPTFRKSKLSPFPFILCDSLVAIVDYFHCLPTIIN